MEECGEEAFIEMAESGEKSNAEKKRKEKKSKQRMTSIKQAASFAS